MAAGKRKALSEANRKNWQRAYEDFLQREAELWATNPHNPNIATGIYPPGMRQLTPDHQRGSVSPLGGQAVDAPAPLRSRTEKR